MGYRTNKKTGKVTEIFNLGWLLRNRKAVDSVTIESSCKSGYDCFVTVTTDKDATSNFYTNFADYEICKKFFNKVGRFPYAVIVDKFKK